MAGAVGGAIHLSKEGRHVAVLAIDNPAKHHTSLGPLRDLTDALGLVLDLGDDSGRDGVRLRQRRRSPAACQSGPTTASARDSALSEPGRR